MKKTIHTEKSLNQLFCIVTQWYVCVSGQCWKVSGVY
jgi:hypothetical protein